MSDLANKLADHFADNPDRADAFNIPQEATGKEVIARIAQIMPNADIGKIHDALQSMAQKEGLIDPPKPPGTAGSSGVMHSLVTGVGGHHAFTGRMGDLVTRFRTATDPAMRAFAKSLNAHRESIEHLPVRQLNHATPATFYHEGEVFVTPSLIRSAGGEQALAHELQHSIAQEKVTNPKLPQDFEAAAHWDDLRSQLKKALPADMRDALDAIMPGIFNEYDGLNELDTRYLSREHKDWLPVLYAAHSNENMLHAAFSSAAFRDYLSGIRYPNGETLYSRVHDWGRMMFGNSAFQFADAAHPYVSDRPGIPTQFNPRKMSLRDAYPLTEAEDRINRITQRYQLNQGVEAALRQIGNISDTPEHQVLARALKTVVAKHPEIVLGLENRVGGYAGGYDFQGDRVSVNPHYDDHCNRAIDSARGRARHDLRQDRCL